MKSNSRNCGPEVRIEDRGLKALANLSEVSIRRVNPLEESGWDEMVLSHPEATFFHSRAWGAVLSESYHFTPMYLLARTEGFTAENAKNAEGNHEIHELHERGEGGQRTEIRDQAAEHSASNAELGTRNSELSAPRLLGLLPAMDVSSAFTGRRGVSLPFTDACQPLASEAVPLQTLLQELGELGKEQRWNYWECRGVKGLPAEMPASLSFLGHTLDLSVGEEGLFAGFKATVRTAIRKGEQAGVRIESSNSLEALGTFYALHCQTRRKHGLPPQPFRFFESIHRHILSRNMGQVVVARAGERPIAADVFFHIGKKVIYKYGASDEACQELRGSNLVMWDAIRWYARQGYQSLDFGRTSLMAEGLRRFKLGWGSVEERIDYLRYGYREQGYVPDEDDSFGWRNALLSRMPVPMLKILGATLYPHLA